MVPGNHAGAVTLLAELQPCGLGGDADVAVS